MSPSPKTGYRRAMTLTEVMVSLVVFVIVILGSLSLLQFGMRTMDTSRAFTQASQILTREMEAMRLRSFSTNGAGTGQLSITAIAASTNYGTFVPFADYSNNGDGKGGTGDAADGAKQPAMGSAILGNTAIQYRNATGNAAGYTCKRSVVLNSAGDLAEITVTVSWKDRSGATHTRSLNSSASKNGLNDSLFALKTTA